MSAELQTAVIAGVISFVTGGSLIAYLKYRRDGKSENRVFIEEERQKLLLQVEQLNNAVSALSSRLIPTNFPMWIKDANRKYIDVNPAWEIQIGGRLNVFKVDALGKTDDEIFAATPDFARLMNEIDDEAAQSGGVAIRKNVSFPKDQNKKIVIKEVLVHDILGQAIYKGMAVPDRL